MPEPKRRWQGVVPAWAATSNTNVVVGRQSAAFGFRSDVFPGDVLRVTATGGIKIDEWPWTQPVSPNGVSSAAPDGWPAPGLRQYSLVGTFNDTLQNVQLGSDSGCFVYRGQPQTFLRLAINDPYVLDNSGQWDVVIRQFW